MKRSPRKPIGGATNRLAAPVPEAHTRAPASKTPAPPLAPTTMGNGTVPPDLFSKEWRQKTETTRGASIEAIARAKTTEESKATVASSSPRSGSSRVGRVFLGGGMRAGEGKKLTGHSEYVMQVMREFFQKHDLHALLTVFREHDHDKSGTFEFPEFRDAMRSVNLDLTEKDMVALFRAADADGSGCLEFSEFINNFRKEGAGDAAEGRREQFFFSLSRPRPLLKRPDRLKLSRKVEGPPVTSRSLDEMLAIIEKKVDQTGPKAVFHRFDENRSGRLSIPEFVLAMKHYGVDCTEAQAEEVITSINKAYGSSMQSNLNYAPFAAFFTHKIDTENTSNTAMRRPKNLGDDADRDDDEHGRGAHTASGVDFKQAKSSMFAGVVKDSDRLDPSAATAEPNIQLLQTMRKLFKDHDIGALRKTFQEFDADKSGTFELAEFKEAMRVVDRTMPEMDVETLFKAADADSSGQVDFSEFMGTLKKVEEIGRKRTVTERRARYIPAATAKAYDLEPSEYKYEAGDELVAGYHNLLKDKIKTRFGDLRRCFRAIDEDGSGKCDRVELSQMLNAMFNLNVPEKAMHRMIDLMDYDGSGDIQFDEFARVFAAEDIRKMKTTTMTAADASLIEPDTMSHWHKMRPPPAALEAIEMATARRIGMNRTELKPISLDDGWDGPDWASRKDQNTGWRGWDLQVHMDKREEYKTGRDIDWTKDSKGGQAESNFRPSQTAAHVETKGMPRLVTRGAAQARNAAAAASATASAEMTTLEGVAASPRAPASPRGPQSPREARAAQRDASQTLGDAEVTKRRLQEAARLAVAVLDRKTMREAWDAGLVAPSLANVTMNERLMRSGLQRSPRDINGSKPLGQGDSGSLSARATMPVRLDGGVRTDGGQRDFSLLDLEDATRTRSVAQCFADAPANSPAFNSEARRLRRLGESSLREEQTEDRSREISRRQAHAARAAKYRDAEAQSRSRADAQREGYDEGRRRRQAQYGATISDLQLAAESKIELEHGRETVLVEPPASIGWGNRPAPPHLTSHWNTITNHHADPPPRGERGETNKIISYRRGFPPGGLAGLSHASWGGAHAQ